MASDRNEMSRRRFTAATSLASGGGGSGRRPARAGGERPRGARPASASAARATRSSGASPSSRTSRSRRSATSTRTCSRAARATRRSRTSPPSSPGYAQDLRRVLDDKDIDGVIVATPNHWHALATIWALQAGKHVYVEKPASHTVWEGRQMVEATKRYGKIVQVGTMNRSRPAVRQAIQFIHDGGIGKVYMARGLCFKPRPCIGEVPGRPDHRRQGSLPERGGAAGARGRLGRGLPREGGLRPLARARAEAGVQPQPLPLQLALALGLRQRRHRQPGPAPVRHRALGPRQERAPGEGRRGGRLLRRAGLAGDARHAHSIFEYADGTVFEFATRGEYTNEEGTQRIGNLFYGTQGLGLDRRRRPQVAELPRAARRRRGRAPTRRPPPRAAATRTC